jgi:hypothetical protein
MVALSSKMNLHLIQSLRLIPIVGLHTLCRDSLCREFLYVFLKNIYVLLYFIGLKLTCMICLQMVEEKKVFLEKVDTLNNVADSLKNSVSTKKFSWCRVTMDIDALDC